METLDAIAARRNIRAYTDEAIPGDVLHAILDAARRAPSASNRQWWDLVVVTEREQLKGLSGVWRGAGHVATSAATVAICAPRQESTFLHEMMHFDLGQLAMSLILAATDLGVGTGHTAVGEQDLARQILGFPETHFCAYLVALGYPKDVTIKPLKKHNRRAFEDVVHMGRF
ncbi:nitroreductase [bacterium SCGC AG-212-C10]|nr:nitroreductase [bacterium SCGC AG-212-C10]